MNVRKRLDYILKHNDIIQKTYKIVMSNVFKFLGIFIKTDKNLILFNAHGQKFNDSPKAIYEFMKDKEEYNNFKYVWALDDPEKYIIPGSEKLKMDTIKYFITSLRAGYWISCVNIERGLNYKKKETIYLNTWHGIPLKFIGNAISERKDYDFSSIDIFCYSGDYEKNIYVRDFNVNPNNLIMSGLPRNDELYNVSNEKIIQIKDKLELPLNKKIILYAPTWRDSDDLGKSYAIKPPIDFEYWEKELSDEYIVLLRTHAYTNQILGIEFNDFVFDFSGYENINDLLIVADILISDYSATIFDFSILEKPIISFCYDYEEYFAKRGLYIDLFKEVPFSSVTSEKSVIEKIKTMNYVDECEKARLFKHKYINADGKATEKCIEKLMG